MNKLALEVNHLSKTYRNGFTALKDVSLNIESGDFYSLLGPNGAGKSTLIGIATTLVNASSGSIKIYGYDVKSQAYQAKRMLGYVPQEINLPSFETCWQILIYQAGYYGLKPRIAKQRAEYFLKRLFLWDKRNTQTVMLSGGMKRRLMIARALMHYPKLLILDEPSAGVDIEIRRSIWEFLSQLKEKGTTILLTTHHLDEAENLCNKVALINEGIIQHQGDMVEFISQLEHETITLNVAETLTQLPCCANDWDLKLISPHTLEASLPKQRAIDELISFLNQQNIKVLRAHSKFNHLEELFINMTQRSKVDEQ